MSAISGLLAPSVPGDEDHFNKDRSGWKDGGWKVHLTVGPDNYEKRVAAICEWLRSYFAGYLTRVFKHLNGGDPHEKDFSIYLGSYATMIEFVRTLEASSVCSHLDLSNSGIADRIVGATGKCAARFEANSRDYWLKGLDGVPFTQTEVNRAILQPGGRALGEQFVSARVAELRKRFGAYFLAEDVD